MKTKITWLAILACAVIVVNASADQPMNASKSKTVAPPPAPISTTAPSASKPKPLIPAVMTPLSKSLPTKSDTQIHRAGNISSRAWTESVGWGQEKTSMAFDSTGHDDGLPLFWFGREPGH
jgi:hypothetical protein